MKKTFALILALVLALSLCACTGDSTVTVTGNVTVTTTDSPASAAPSAPAEPSKPADPPAPSAEPEPSQEPVQSEEPEPSQEPAQPEPDTAFPRGIPASPADARDINWGKMNEENEWYLNGDRTCGTYFVYDGMFTITFYENGTETEYDATAGDYLTDDETGGAQFKFSFPSIMTAHDEVSGSDYIRLDTKTFVESLTSAQFEDARAPGWTVDFGADGSFRFKTSQDRSGQWWMERGTIIMYHFDGDPETSTGWFQVFFHDGAWTVEHLESASKYYPVQ